MLQFHSFFEPLGTTQLSLSIPFQFKALLSYHFQSVFGDPLSETGSTILL